VYLAEVALYFARQLLKPNCLGPIKTFQGAVFEEQLESARQTFTKVRFAKPDDGTQF
jgi:23S rRNA U2552 (ribose-2'-O)-methylase RlmE/FtsJ